MKKVREKLHQFGLTVTRPRAMILKCLWNRKDHPDAEMIYQAVHEKIPSLSKDTVYRTLNLFSRKGLIVQLAVPTHRFRFDGGIEPHDHFLCTTCEKIVDIELGEDTGDPVPEKVLKEGRVETLQRVYLGTCHLCQHVMLG